MSLYVRVICDKFVLVYAVKALIYLESSLY
jgi:hypothetical protein